MWLGLTCNLRCRFCYFLDRIEDPAHPEHPFIGLEKARAIGRTLVGYYGNNSVDIQGGEPTLYPEIEPLVAYFAGIGLSPTLITNALALSDPTRVEQLRRAGVRDFLISVQGLGEVYDQLVRRPGAHALQRRALDTLQEAGVPFRFNTVLTRAVLPQLDEIAALAVETGAGVVNFLGYNPFFDQQTDRRERELVPAYDELRGPLRTAIDRLDAEAVEVNVRYLPLCLLSKPYRPHLYGYRQLPYDLHENDYASWSWTELPAQRTAGTPLSPPLGLGRRLRLGRLRRPLRALDRRWPTLGGALHRLKQALERRWADDGVGPVRNADPAGRGDRASDGYPAAGPDAVDRRYQQDATVRAAEYTGYRHVPVCRTCGLRPICDGVYGDYLALFGEADVRPVPLAAPVTDPQHYTRHQYKVIHPLDRWLEADA
jgi:pyruvate-formate lyase-activating enzyme